MSEDHSDLHPARVPVILYRDGTTSEGGKWPPIPLGRDIIFLRHSQPQPKEAEMPDKKGYGTKGKPVSSSNDKRKEKSSGKGSGRKK